MTNEQLEDFSALWANGVNVGKIWNKIKERFVSGYHDQTSYSNSWRMQARTNLGIGTPAQDYMWIGGANNTVTTVQTSALGRTLLNATSGSVISGLYAERASRLTNTSAVGSTSLPVYFTSGGVPAVINALSVPGNIQSTGGGVSAVGLADLAFIGGGGGSNASEIYIGSTRYPFNENGQAYLPAYPSDFYTQAAADNKFATIAQLNTINAKIPSAATSSNQLADKAFVNSSIATATATFRGTVTATADSEAAAQTALATITTKDLNDYAFVKVENTPQTGVDKYKRYKWSGSAWVFEYTLNNSSFTSDQWNAINSGATSTIIGNILPKTIGTAKGDLITFSAASTPVRLGIGTTGQFLKVVSGAPAWASFTTPTVAWTEGSSAGPTLTVTTDGGSSAAVAIPSATASASGVVTTGAQTFAGAKTFNGGIVFPNNVGIKGNNSSNVSVDLLILNSNNNLIIGSQDAQVANKPTTYLFGNNIYMRCWNGSNYSDAISITPSQIGLYIGTKKEASLTAYGFSALDGGVSANGLVDLAVIGGGGGGSASSIKFGSASAISADENGLMTVPFSIASNTTNAVSVSVGGATANITPSTLRTSLGLGTVYSHGYGEFVTTLGVSGNTLTWSKGGTAQTAITIPYATNAGQLGGHASDWYQQKVTAKGSQTQPVYVSADGTFSVTKTYAGGTSVTLNGESKSAAVAALYAPTAAGTAGQWLKSSGSGAPVWESPANMLAGMATKLETEAMPNQEFIFRNSPKTIGADSLKLDKILGRTVVWNQYLKNADFVNTNDWTGSNLSVSDNVITTGINATSGTYTGVTQTLAISPIEGHLYYLAGEIKTNDNSSGSLFVVAANSASGLSYSKDGVNDTFVKLSAIKQCIVPQTRLIFGQLNARSGVVLQVKKVRFIDLTLMFGAGNEPTSVADFERDYGYLLANPDYNPGQLINNAAEGLETVGFNLWDSKIVYDSLVIRATTGELVTSSSYTRWGVCDYIPILPNQTYYFSDAFGANSTNVGVCYYDRSKNFIGGSVINENNAFTRTTPADAYYMRLSVKKENLSTACINLSDPAKNGTYEPYKRNVLDLHLENIQVKSPNIWDEAWEVGSINGSTGENVSYNSCIRTKNYTPIEPNTEYYSSSLGNVFLYDGNKSFIKSITLSSSGSWVSVSNAAYMRQSFKDAYGTTYNNDICINESNRTFNGKYFPHGVLTFNGLKQVGNVRDEIVGSKYIRRVGSVDLGTLTYSASSYGFTAALPMRSWSSPTPLGSGLISAKYLGTSSTTWANMNNMEMGSNGQSLRIKDTAYAAADAFKTAMSGVYLNYELATYETYDLISPIPSAMPAGTTERRLPEDTSDSILAPFACDMTYGTNPGDILASGIAWEKIWGRATLNKGVLSDALVSNDVNNGEWFEFNVGGVKMYLSFAVADGAFRLAIADDKSNPTISKEFTFATLDDNDIDAICD